MKIRLNGESVETEAATLHELLRTLGFKDEEKIATAVDGEFVPRNERVRRALTEGSEIEVVAPRQGG